MRTHMYILYTIPQLDEVDLGDKGFNGGGGDGAGEVPWGQGGVQRKIGRRTCRIKQKKRKVTK